MKEKSVAELKAMIDSKVAFQLIDVREPHEVEIATLGGDLIPMGDVVDELDKIKRDIPVVLHCRSGKRSATIIDYLEQNYHYDNLYNLRGGILAWADEIDHSMAKY